MVIGSPGRRPLYETAFTMWPEPRSVMCGRNAVLVRTAPRRLVSSIQAQSLLEIRSSLPCRRTPAALSTMSTLPIALIASRASERTDASLRTSVDSAIADSLVPSLRISAMVRSIRGVSKSAITMFAPCLAMALATARPTPLPPPVTTATLRHAPAHPSQRAGPEWLRPFEAQGGPVFVDLHEGDRLVSRLAGDLAQHVALGPPGCGGQVRRSPRGAALRVRDPEQPVRLHRLDRRRPQRAELVHVTHEQLHDVVDRRRLERSENVRRRRREVGDVSGRSVDDCDVMVRRHAQLLGQHREPGRVLAQREQRPL